MGAQAGGDSEEGTPPRSYVLRPIDGRLRYLRRGRDVRQGEAQPVQEADVALDALSLHLSSAFPPPSAALPVTGSLAGRGAMSCLLRTTAKHATAYITDCCRLRCRSLAQ